MSQAPEHGQVGPQGEQEHVSVHTEASSFTPQHEVPEPLVPQLNAVPQAVPYQHPQMAANMLQFLQQMAGAHVPPPPPPLPMVVVTIEKLKKNGAEEFCGGQIAEPMVAKRWLERVSRVLGTLRVPAEQRGDLAIALLQDAAYDWWKRAGANIPETVPWVTFDELFREEYVPEHFMEEKRDEFMKFTQGELAEYGRDLVPTMENRCKRFREGLRPTNPGEAFPTAPAASAPAAQPAPSQKSVAASSQPKRPAQSTQSGKAPTRTYAMHGRTEQPAYDVIMGMFTLFDTSISALIDPGSTLSYVCTSMPESFNIPRENLENPVIVSNPLGHSLCLKYIYPGCPLVVQGKSFPANLIELPHREFDVILGMDWLTANQAVVDCGTHTVRLKAEDGNDVLIRGELFPKAPEFISYMQARRLIRKK
ncbi:unnamed protein product [Cuscuta campestris]|uniref:Retrotransposon gag domain-containing protein n=1 Tax=Cuscuta campestris TaxID=132261 RepID=A0A484N394_9ASTE|nr:unnamed protein product [Cuscuta campestris]